MPLLLDVDLDAPGTGTDTDTDTDTETIIASKPVGPGRWLTVRPGWRGGAWLCLEEVEVEERGGGTGALDRWAYDAVDLAVGAMALYDPRDDADGPGGWTRRAPGLAPTSRECIPA